LGETLSLRDAILAAKDFKIAPVKVASEWPEAGTVFVRTMDGDRRDAWEFWCFQRKEDGTMKNARGALAASALCDADGNYLFTMDDAEALGKKSAVALTKIYTAAMKINKIGEADIGELEKNSESGQSAASISA